MDRVVTGEVVQAVERNRGPHTGVGVFETRLELWVVRGDRGQRRQVPTGRAAGDRHPVRVAAVFGDVFLGPRQGPLDVDDLVGPGRARAEPVVDRHAHPAQLGQMAHQRISLLPFASHHPRATRNLQQHRRFPTAVEVGPSPDVEMVPRAVFAVGDVGVVRVVAVDARHADQARRFRRAGAFRPLPQVARIGPAIGAQAGIERRGQRLIGLVADAVQTCQPQPGQRRHQPTEPAHPRGELAESPRPATRTVRRSTAGAVRKRTPQS